MRTTPHSGAYLSRIRHGAWRGSRRTWRRYKQAFPQSCLQWLRGTNQRMKLKWWIYVVLGAVRGVHAAVARGDQVLFAAAGVSTFSPSLRPSSEWPQRLQQQQHTTKISKITASIPLHKPSNSEIYVLSLSIGTPPQKQSVLLDTGSSELVVYDARAEQCRGGCGCGGGYAPPLTRRRTHEVAGESERFVLGFANESATATGRVIFDDVYLTTTITTATTIDSNDNNKNSSNEGCGGVGHAKLKLARHPIAVIDRVRILDFACEGVFGLAGASARQILGIPGVPHAMTLASQLISPPSSFPSSSSSDSSSSNDEGEGDDDNNAIEKQERMGFGIYLGPRSAELRETISQAGGCAESVNGVLDIVTIGEEHSRLRYRYAQNDSLNPVPFSSSSSLDDDENDHTGDDSYTITLLSISLPSAALPTFSAISTPPIPLLLDTGTLGIHLPDSLADTLARTITSLATYDPHAPGYIVPCTLLTSTRCVTFTFAADNGTKSVCVGIHELVRPHPQSPSGICLLDVIRESTYDVGNILGIAFLSSVYALFEPSSHSVHLAQAAYYDHLISAG
ncbi:aspartic peptidase domain-containing protein [Limtongia smithiae]|uniref:aspartic peptidase domain-containing protein n=1 Tax=Limtongia smithiae TaxID=1125753 RepID=UPI0034D01915